MEVLPGRSSTSYTCCNKELPFLFNPQLLEQDSFSRSVSQALSYKAVLKLRGPTESAVDAFNCRFQFSRNIYKFGHHPSMGPLPQIAPSMLSSDFANLAAEAKRMLDCGADWLHMDVMVRACGRAGDKGSVCHAGSDDVRCESVRPSIHHVKACIRIILCSLRDSQNVPPVA